MKISRRTFLDAALATGLGLAFGDLDAIAAQRQIGPSLFRRFQDLSRHFIFEGG